VSNRGLPAQAGAKAPTERAPGANAAGAHSRLDDDDFPAYSMGRAADMIGVTAQFLRSLGDAGLISPQRSGGGHRRYSRHQLRLATRARELVDGGVDLAPACRIVRLEDDLQAANRHIHELEDDLQAADRRVNELQSDLQAANRRVNELAGRLPRQRERSPAPASTVSTVSRATAADQEAAGGRRR